jgi:hypothetical protein
MKIWVDNGLWNTSLWMILCLAYQIAQRVTDILAKSSLDSVSDMTKSHYFTEGSSLEHICSVISSSAKAHTHHATEQFSNECLQESSAPQMEELVVSTIPLRHRTSPVGKECCARRHKKTRSFDGTCASRIHSTQNKAARRYWI